MEIRVLKYFLTVAREESITKGAEILHITQPTLSRQLMQLEEELGVELFTRGKSKITLTDEGMLLRRRAEEILDLVDKTEREFGEQDNLITGQIFIGAGETNAMHVLANLIKEFNKEYPQVKYNLYSGNADDIKEKIDKGLIDIGLLTEPVNIEKYDFVRLPNKEIWGVLMQKDSPLAKKENIKPEDLSNMAVINTKRPMVQNEIENWFGTQYEKINVIATYNLIYNAAIMVEEGLGYAICFEKLVNINNETNLCFKPFYPKLETGTVIVWKKHQVFSAATTKFIEKIINALKA
ncbi:DNA-binding transcriptional LysR family regulator [Clostridium saccharoperbutylacetonicum]|uniref:Transcriptional regulator n=1 Tax=Clostridium saccharoperbutylacetonicum N1-4(HMT) TaxID=931276 RepID=M1MGU0_9CLOT|nr:LysR family transcriptional regulator [Clostridium saccharoperbutylacetonicum]AGF55558.1 transcriptional regulator [Clostridium saccharoperbutylacetonicum N1-4(HMT)]NRT63722.1 DNA-binding transcriptional LysR family regulator [Clostridium saccharoperbutylacetonicum]NSB27085.1 DNA-binding transcriptional LysR family regulator [Clostridium saccharoperbutylacetonicum]NSB40570.1 DNA-binding transcriptional LysR family regulator [Clostridium saccharoperbutylacetonicum]